jgi:hypothetical protein
MLDNQIHKICTKPFQIKKQFTWFWSYELPNKIVQLIDM